MTTQTAAAPSAGPTADDIQPTKNETADRIATGTITALPFVALRRRTLAFAITGVVILGAGWACVGGSR